MKLAVVCASGIGDALILETVSHAVRRIGWEATTFSNHLACFGRWLPAGAKTEPQPSLEEIEQRLSRFDAVFLQHDNSPKAYKIKSSSPIPVFSFYGAHVEKKHGPFDPAQDFAANRNATMVDNISAAAQRFFGVKPAGNGFSPPPGLIHKRFKRRIAIHPTASSTDKIWPRCKFLEVAELLRQEGYDPIFTVAPHERLEWDAPEFPTLEDLATFLYESGSFLGNDSGTAHLASLLQLPHLVIAGNGLQIPLWRTGWHQGAVAAAPSWLMKFKFLRTRWKPLITTNSVIKNFKLNVLRN